MAFVPAGVSLTDQMTHRPIDSVPGERFPVLVMTGNEPRVRFLDELHPRLPAGSSYLVPPGREDAIEAAINRDGGSWTLDVRHLGPGRQHIELVWVDDGYDGGGYEATHNAVIPRYRKITGPGFGIVVGGAALGINALLWVSILLVLRWRRRRAVAIIALLSLSLMSCLSTAHVERVRFCARIVPSPGSTASGLA